MMGIMFMLMFTSCLILALVASNVATYSIILIINQHGQKNKTQSTLLRNMVTLLMMVVLMTMAIMMMVIMMMTMVIMSISRTKTKLTLLLNM